eukprot:TRINITY_DN12808_c1_g1_i1.p1 TRINITY_DN12808_c1_g1~~TRINITY_DN12808_c1_g1_i1.p1  ORF type:complete len:172 (+),score=4.08 TRINITY_DN12808_c1_g1_i1:1-516(+)
MDLCLVPRCRGCPCRGCPGVAMAPHSGRSQSVLPRHPSTRSRRTPNPHASSGEFFDSGPSRSDQQPQGPKDARPSSSTPSTEPAAQGPPIEDPPLTDSQWWVGIVAYAVTNVGFIKLFEYCAGQTEIMLTLRAMALFYAVAYALRLLLRHVVGLKPSFPQFWWEGIPKRSK